MKPAYEGILFDLDGTLIDSVRDIVEALNAGLAAIGRRSLPLHVGRGFIGDGLPRLLERALEATGGPVDAPLVAAALQAVRDHYGAHPVRYTVAYPGIPELLRDLAPTPLAVVSNKPEQLCRTVLAALGLAARFATVLGGDSLPERKPDPAPVREALRRLGIRDPRRALLVGDGPQDMAAGRAAGVRILGVVWGIAQPPQDGPDAPEWRAATVEELRQHLGLP